VWFLRHGKTPFDYETSEYDNFIQMLCNGKDTRLVEDHGISFGSLPEQADFIGYSPLKRSADTARVLDKKLKAKKLEELDFLREVEFDRDIIRPEVFTLLK
jgi:broad specificity phosphatase PhoE